jgi:hypothetical protein
VMISPTIAAASSTKASIDVLMLTHQRRCI